MSIAIATHICAQCGAEFEPPKLPHNPGTFCSTACRDAANRARFWNPTAYYRRQGIAIEPSETKPGRMAKMTDQELNAELRRIRRELDDRPRMAGDRLWRVEQMATQRLNAWTVHQIAVYHGVSRDVVKDIIEAM